MPADAILEVFGRVQSYGTSQRRVPYDCTRPNTSKMAAAGIQYLLYYLTLFINYPNCNIRRDFRVTIFFIFIHLHENGSQPYSWAHALVALSNKGLSFIIAFFRGSSLLKHACTSVPSNKLPDLLYFNLMLIYEWYATVVTNQSVATK